MGSSRAERSAAGAARRGRWRPRRKTRKSGLRHAISAVLPAARRQSIAPAPMLYCNGGPARAVFRHASFAGLRPARIINRGSPHEGYGRTLRDGC
jgi:hypothetical protein